MNDAGDDLSTQELRLAQIRREDTEREAAERTPDPDEAATHERRAERAAYLKDKLGEQAEALGEDT